MRVGQAPTLVVGGLVAVGLLVAAVADWEPGAVLIGVALLLAAGLRLALPVRQAGWLVVRSRPFDTCLLAATGATVVALASSIPRG